MKDYRADIDGLRALAILPVLFFHAGLGAFSGGFVGVDVFFVISGYLITVIILQDEGRGIPSIAQFYERRVRRIVPALITVLLCSCLAAWVILPPDQLKAFGKTVLSLSVFGSNILFWKQSGYFDEPAETIPLLHTWSLAVEEQFYAVFPIAVLFIRKCARSRYIFGLGLFTVASIAISIWGVEYRSAATFYLTPTRAWELLLGSLTALGACPNLESRTLRNILSVVAIGLIVWPVLGYSRTTPFPGLAAIPPTLGAAILIHAGSCGDSWVKRGLGWKPLVGVGLISYSLYLWHWPLLVFAQLASSFPLAMAQKWALLALAAVLASLTWWYVEVPFRKKAILAGRARLMAAAAISALCLAGFNLIIIREDGVPQRINPTIREAVLANSAIKTTWAYPEACRANFRRKFAAQDPITFCPVGGAGTSMLLFWGDSQIEQLFPVLSEVAQEGSLLGRKIVTATSGGCPPVLGLNRVDAGFDCDGFNRRVAERAMQPDVDAVVLGSAVYPWSGICKSGFTCTSFIDGNEFYDFLQRSVRGELRQLASANKRIIILMPFPVYEVSIPEYLNKKIMLGQEPTLRLTREEHLRRVADVASIWQRAAVEVNATVVDPSEVLCASDECVYRRGLIALYLDGSHFGVELAELIGPILVTALLGETTSASRSLPGLRRNEACDHRNIKALDEHRHFFCGSDGRVITGAEEPTSADASRNQ
jgi:peptidoglycan/LPS O-acetylase OafA/YrhL